MIIARITKKESHKSGWAIICYIEFGTLATLTFIKYYDPPKPGCSGVLVCI